MCNKTIVTATLITSLFPAVAWAQQAALNLSANTGVFSQESNVSVCGRWKGRWEEGGVEGAASVVISCNDHSSPVGEFQLQGLGQDGTGKSAGSMPGKISGNEILFVRSWGTTSLKANTDSGCKLGESLTGSYKKTNGSSGTYRFCAD